jgi:hypothetical protein
MKAGVEVGEATDMVRRVEALGAMVMGSKARPSPVNRQRCVTFPGRGA